jgi:hypothetical protein
VPTLVHLQVGKTSALSSVVCLLILTHRQPEGSGLEARYIGGIAERQHTRDFVPLAARDAGLVPRRLRLTNVEMNKVGAGNNNGVSIDVDGCVAVFVWTKENVFGAHIQEHHAIAVINELKNLLGGFASHVTHVNILYPQTGKKDLEVVEEELAKIGIEAYPTSIEYSFASTSLGHDFRATKDKPGKVVDY